MLKNYLQIDRVIETWARLRLINLFVRNTPFLYPLKLAENRKGCTGMKRLNSFCIQFWKERKLDCVLW